jgi:hypothetical protein
MASISCWKYFLASFSRSFPWRAYKYLMLSVTIDLYLKNDLGTWNHVSYVCAPITTQVQVFSISNLGPYFFLTLKSPRSF